MSIGYAVSPQGRGLAYARFAGAGGGRVVCCSFSAGPQERGAGYAALAAMLPVVRRHTAKAAIEIEDAELVAELTTRCGVPVALMLPHVQARCALNALDSWKLIAGDGPRDLSARALAEVSLSVAA